ncbi:MAG: hypothetical protein CML02_08800 [Pseudooceanicola sp.]|nr:hypothetical protein [Pseudooceanicola sp.]
MARRLILHIGDCKTGSTVLQTMLARGDCMPRNARLFVPGNGVHGALPRSLGQRPAQYPARWKGMAKRLAEAEWDVAILSSELFEFIDPGKVARALRDHMGQWWDDLSVLVYVRPHAGRVLSQFCENIKLGHDTGTLDEFYRRFRRAGRLNYAERLEGWRAEFGDKLVVRPFVRDHLHQGDVRHDFAAQVFGADGYSLSDTGQDDNSALSIPDLALMRVLQRVMNDGNVPVDTRVSLGKQLGQFLRNNALPDPAPKLRLHRKIAEDIRTRSADDAVRMDTEWVGAPCFAPALDSINSRPDAADLSPEAIFDPATLRRITVWATLLLRQAQADPEGFGRMVRGQGQPD